MSGLPGEFHSDAAERWRRRILVVTTLGYIGCFAVWTIFAIIGVEIQRQYGLSDTEFGLLVGIPFLSGSLMRVVLGIWADRHGGRRLFLGVMVIAAVATWFVADATAFPMLLAVVRHRIVEPSMDALCDQTPGEGIGPRHRRVPIPTRVAAEPGGSRPRAVRSREGPKSQSYPMNCSCSTHSCASLVDGGPMPPPKFCHTGGAVDPDWLFRHRHGRRL